VVTEPAVAENEALVACRHDHGAGTVRAVLSLLNVTG
jgi:hypothetical protein